jgi:type 1 fimbriae regulatory protein FimB/type 1 fimbriae regulatory protein FimE
MTPLKNTQRDNTTERNYLNDSELEALFKEAKNNKKYRHSKRNYLFVLFSYRHALRCLEACRLKWSDIDFKNHTIFISRLKGSKSTTHPLAKDELELLRWIKKEYESQVYIFSKTNGLPLATTSIRKLFLQYRDATGIEHLHHHCLKHTCCTKLAQQGWDILQIQAYVGHTNIQNTLVYTKVISQDLGHWWER